MSLTTATLADASAAANTPVLRVMDIPQSTWPELLARFGLLAVAVPDHTPIAGSYWGDSEAGLLGQHLYFRADTPLQSVLHEASHYICMDESRRRVLQKDAGGDYDEENAVCYLQILLADHVIGFGRDRMLADMDAWGYTFRLGSARAWFEQEAQAAQQWLIAANIIDPALQPTWQCR
jgi:hypothetical protein